MVIYFLFALGSLFLSLLVVLVHYDMLKKMLCLLTKKHQKKQCTKSRESIVTASILGFNIIILTSCGLASTSKKLRRKFQKST